MTDFSSNLDNMQDLQKRRERVFDSIRSRKLDLKRSTDSVETGIDELYDSDADREDKAFLIKSRGRFLDLEI